MRPTRRTALVGAAALGVGGVGVGVGVGGAAAAPARRIVSLNPCLDAILLAVAHPGQIAALSHYSRQPMVSSVGEAAKRFAFTYESAEEVIALSPDLVLASRHSSLATRNALKRLGVAVEAFRTPDTIEESLVQVRRIAGLAGQPQRGDAAVARIEAALAAAAAPRGARPVRALVFQRNGFSSGPDTLVDELLRRTGFRNAAADYGATRTTDIDLDAVVSDPPDVLLSGATLPGAPTWGERVMRHPAFERLRGRVRIVSFPQHLMFCGGPNLVEAADRLAKARRLVA